MNDSDLKKEQRKKALEEKRARLRALKSRGKTTEPEVSSPKPDKKQEELAKLATVDSVEGLLESLSLPTPEPVQSTAQSLVEEKKAAEITKITPTLVLQQRVAEFEVSPQIITTYTKGTQTVSLQTDDDDDFDITPLPHPKPIDTSMNIQIQPPSQKESTTSSTKLEPSEEVESLSESDIQRMLYSKELEDFLDSATRITERAIQVDRKFDILADYKGELGDLQAGSAEQLTLHNTLFDERWSKKRAVTSIDWSPKFPELLLASYSASKGSSQDADGIVLVWTIDNLLERPEYEFTCQSPVLTAQFPKFQPSIVIGGTYSGQIVLWDTRAKSTPVQRSPLSSTGHTHPIFCLDVVGTQNAHNLVTVSTDGTLCAWSLSNLSQPIEQLALNTPKVSSKNTAPAATCIAFEESQVNQFFIGTEEGAIYRGARHGSSQGLSDRFARAPTSSNPYEEVEQVDYRFTGHRAPITGIDFHKSNGDIDFSSYFLTSSFDWTCKLWNTRQTDAPIWTFQAGSDNVYDTKWSPSHPAMFATADGAGKLNLWNMNYDIEVPYIQETVSKHAVNQIAWSHDSKKIVCGDSAGYLYIYDVGEICNPSADDWVNLDNTIAKLPTKHSETIEDSLY